MTLMVMKRLESENLIADAVRAGVVDPNKVTQYQIFKRWNSLHELYGIVRSYGIVAKENGVSVRTVRRAVSVYR